MLTLICKPTFSKRLHPRRFTGFLFEFQMKLKLMRWLSFTVQIDMLPMNIVLNIVNHENLRLFRYFILSTLPKTGKQCAHHIFLIWNQSQNRRKSFCWAVSIQHVNMCGKVELVSFYSLSHNNRWISESVLVTMIRIGFERIDRKYCRKCLEIWQIT